MYADIWRAAAFSLFGISVLGTYEWKIVAVGCIGIGCL